MIAVVGAGLVVLTAAGVPADVVAVAGYRFGQPLWFLGVYLLCQALLPALAAAHGRAPLATMAALVTAAVAVDGARAATGFEGIGFLNLAFVWMALQQVGFFLADGAVDRLSARVRAGAAGVAVAGLIVAWTSGTYSPDLIANINPPTAALLLVGVAHTAALSLVRERLQRVSRRPRVAAFTGFVTRRTMTIYLWHMPVLLGMAGTVAAVALATGIAPPEPSTAAWWLSRPLWLAAVLGLTGALAIGLARIENAAAPAATTSPQRVAAGVTAGLVAIVMLLAAGTTPLTATIAVVLIVAALRRARPRAAGTARPNAVTG